MSPSEFYLPTVCFHVVSWESTQLANEKVSSNNRNLNQVPLKAARVVILHGSGLQCVMVMVPGWGGRGGRGLHVFLVVVVHFYKSYIFGIQIFNP